MNWNVWIWAKWFSSMNSLATEDPLNSPNLWKNNLSSGKPETFFPLPIANSCVTGWWDCEMGEEWHKLWNGNQHGNISSGEYCIAGHIGDILCYILSKYSCEVKRVLKQWFPVNRTSLQKTIPNGRQRLAWSVHLGLIQKFVLEPQSIICWVTLLDFSRRWIHSMNSNFFYFLAVNAFLAVLFGIIMTE